MSSPRTSATDEVQIRYALSHLLDNIGTRDPNIFLKTVHPDAHSLTHHTGLFESRRSLTHLSALKDIPGHIDERFLEPWDIRCWGKLAIITAMSEVRLDAKLVWTGWNGIVLHKVRDPRQKDGSGKGEEEWLITGVLDCLVNAEEGERS